MNFLIRADSSNDMGIGHIMRCLAIAQTGIKRGHTFSFISKENVHFASSQIKQSKIKTYTIMKDSSETEEALYLSKICQNQAIDYIIVDGYHYSNSLRKLIKSIGPKIISISDHDREKNLHADIVLAPSFEVVSKKLINKNPETVFIHGNNYTILRPAITASVKNIPPLKERKETLISFGGSDPFGLTLPTACETLRISSNVVNIITSSSTCNLFEIEKIAKANPQQINLHKDCQNIENVILSCGIAISAGGNTLNELVTLQTPTIAVVVADNQYNNSNKLAQLGACELVDVREIIKKPEKIGVNIAQTYRNLRNSNSHRERMVDIAINTFDGLGIERFFDKLEHRVS